MQIIDKRQSLGRADFPSLDFAFILLLLFMT